MMERRKAARIATKIKFNYQILSLDGTAEPGYSAIIKNISAEGLAFQTQKELPIATKLKLQLVLPGLSSLMNIKGEVVRVEKLLSLDSFAVGVVFVELSASDKEQIKERID